MDAFLRGGRKLGTWNLDSIFFFCLLSEISLFYGPRLFGLHGSWTWGPKRLCTEMSKRYI